jgi:hypothetical protein
MEYHELHKLTGINYYLKVMFSKFSSVVCACMQRVMIFFSQMVMAEKCNVSENQKTSRDQEFIDIDSDHKDPQLCSLYAADIYSNLRVAEVCTLYAKKFSFFIYPFLFLLFFFFHNFVLCECKRISFFNNRF